MTKSHLNTNKQFMIGNGILAFAVIFVVVIFIYLSMRMSRDEVVEAKYQEVYTVSVDDSLVGDSLSIFVNDSVIYNGLPDSAGVVVRFNRFADESSMLVFDAATGFVSAFSLDAAGEDFCLYSEEGTLYKK